METHTIELSTDELLLVARVTGIILGYAVPDRYCDRGLVLAIFNRAQQKLLESATATGSEGHCGFKSELCNPEMFPASK
jgi:hypothetical protein